MGSHKHGISGVSGRSSGEKQRMALDENRSLELKREIRERRRGQMFQSIRELFAKLTR